MYKITCFAPIISEQLCAALKGLRFVSHKHGFEWSMNEHIFRIEPFKNQSRDSMKGFRVLFNGEMDGGIYLFDTSLGWLAPSIVGVEYSFSHPSMKQQDWISDLMNKSFKTLDSRGLFQKGNVGVVVVNDGINLQVRSSKGKQLKLLDTLKEIQVIREELTPAEFDLFSFVGEGVAV